MQPIKTILGIICGLLVVGFVVYAIDIASAPFCKPIETVLGFLIVVVLTLCSLLLVILGFINITGRHAKKEPGWPSIIIGALLSYFFLFHFWPKNWPFR